MVLFCFVFLCVFGRCVCVRCVWRIGCLGIGRLIPTPTTHRFTVKYHNHPTHITNLDNIKSAHCGVCLMVPSLPYRYSSDVRRSWYSMFFLSFRPSASHCNCRRPSSTHAVRRIPTVKTQRGQSNITGGTRKETHKKNNEKGEKKQTNKTI